MHSFKGEFAKKNKHKPRETLHLTDISHTNHLIRQIPRARYEKSKNSEMKGRKET